MVAMLHPMDIVVTDDISIMTGYDVQPAVIPDKQPGKRLISLQEPIQIIYEDWVSPVDLYSVNSDDINVTNQDAGSDQSTSSVLNDTDKPAIRLANMTLSRAVKANASYKILSLIEMSERFRIDGVLHEIMHPPKSIYPLLISGSR